MTASIFDDRVASGDDGAVAIEADESGAAGVEALRRRQVKVSKEIRKCLCEQK